MDSSSGDSAVVGILALVAATAASSSDAESAASQVWPAFVLVTGLLLVGLVADDDGLFAAAGHRLARVAKSGVALYVGATVMVGVVTALLNLDTSVAFLTPVLVYSARSRGEGEAPLLYGCLLVSNAGSLFLPGSNLTNLIVLGHFRLTGMEFSRNVGPRACGTYCYCSRCCSLGAPGAACDRGRPGAGRTTRSWPRTVDRCGRHGSRGYPALSCSPGRGVGAAAISARVAAGRERPGRRVDDARSSRSRRLVWCGGRSGHVGPIVVGAGRGLSHLDLWGTAVVAAASAVLVNNLPAASLLAARTPAQPFALLVGLNLGPNLFVTGSLAWLLWLRAARSAGARRSIAKASGMGVLAVPLSLAAAVGILSLTGPR